MFSLLLCHSCNLGFLAVMRWQLFSSFFFNGNHTERGGGCITTKGRHKSPQLTRNYKRSEMKRCRPESLSLPLELQLLRGICGLGAMFLRQPFVDDTDRRPYITAVFTWILSPSFFPFSFSSHSGRKKKSDAHLLPQPPAHLSFKRRKLCRLLWTLRRLNSFKISFNYRPRETAETFFFELAIIAFVGSSIIRTWRYMKNLCPSRQEKHASERERKSKAFPWWQQQAVTENAAGRVMDQEVPRMCGLDRCVGTKLRFCVP